MRAPRKCFWHDQIRAGIVGTVLLIALLTGLSAIGIPDRIESKAHHALTEQGG